MTTFTHWSRLGQFLTYIKPVCILKVAIRTTFCIAGIIYCTCNLVTDIQCTLYKSAFNKHFQQIVCQNKSAKIYSEKNITVCNAVYFRLCIDLMHILPPGWGIRWLPHLKVAECTFPMWRNSFFAILLLLCMKIRHGSISNQISTCRTVYERKIMYIASCKTLPGSSFG